MNDNHAQNDTDFVVLTSGTDIGYEAGFNFLEIPLEDPDPESQAFDSAVSTLAANFETLLTRSNVGGNWGPRMSGITRAVVRGLAEYQVRTDEAVTMLDMAFLLAGGEDRQRIHEVMDEDRIERMQQATYIVDKYLQANLEPIFQRLWEWVISRAVRSVVGHPSTTVSIDDIVREGKTLVVESAALADSEKQLITTALLQRTWMAVQEQTHRDNQPNPPQFSFVCRDEYGRISTGKNISSIRREAEEYDFSTTFGDAMFDDNIFSEFEDNIFPETVKSATENGSPPFLALFPQDDDDAQNDDLKYIDRIGN